MEVPKVLVPMCRLLKSGWIVMKLRTLNEDGFVDEADYELLL